MPPEAAPITIISTILLGYSSETSTIRHATGAAIGKSVPPIYCKQTGYAMKWHPE
jgi:hypothetical protein